MCVCVMRTRSVYLMTYHVLGYDVVNGLQYRVPLLQALLLCTHMIIRHKSSHKRHHIVREQGICIGFDTHEKS